MCNAITIISRLDEEDHGLLPPGRGAPRRAIGAEEVERGIQLGVLRRAGCGDSLLNDAMVWRVDARPHRRAEMSDDVLVLFETVSNMRVGNPVFGRAAGLGHA